ncbi:hypothetical protein AGLY_007469 [Aphis glycines]|uniref:Uncharacterized protein n=1 Tax=Aphis glycines TaxID=307491 RepID=A0A6G0TM99_APHGL|nr:hypothetical protein AGLY_007469 [Aphis glycines]
MKPRRIELYQPLENTTHFNHNFITLNQLMLKLYQPEDITYYVQLLKAYEIRVSLIGATSASCFLFSLWMFSSVDFRFLLKNRADLNTWYQLSCHDWETKKKATAAKRSNTEAIVPINASFIRNLKHLHNTYPNNNNKKLLNVQLYENLKLDLVVICRHKCALSDSNAAVLINALQILTLERHARERRTHEHDQAQEQLAVAGTVLGQHAVTLAEHVQRVDGPDDVLVQRQLVAGLFGLSASSVVVDEHERERERGQPQSDGHAVRGREAHVDHHEPVDEHSQYAAHGDGAADHAVLDRPPLVRAVPPLNSIGGPPVSDSAAACAVAVSAGDTDHTTVQYSDSASASIWPTTGSTISGRRRPCRSLHVPAAMARAMGTSCVTSAFQPLMGATTCCAVASSRHLEPTRPAISPVGSHALYSNRLVLRHPENTIATK